MNQTKSTKEESCKNLDLVSAFYIVYKVAQEARTNCDL